MTPFAKRERCSSSKARALEALPAWRASSAWRKSSASAATAVELGAGASWTCVATVDSGALLSRGDVFDASGRTTDVDAGTSGALGARSCTPRSDRGASRLRASAPDRNAAGPGAAIGPAAGDAGSVSEVSEGNGTSIAVEGNVGSVVLPGVDAAGKPVFLIDTCKTMALVAIAAPTSAAMASLAAGTSTPPSLAVVAAADLPAPPALIAGVADVRPVPKPSCMNSFRFTRLGSSPFATLRDPSSSTLSSDVGSLIASSNYRVRGAAGRARR